MRLDVFLKRTGLLKQRDLAKQFCEAGQVKVNGTEAKASKLVAPGHSIMLETTSGFLEIEVVALPDRNYKRKAGEAFYRITGERHKEVS